jgi:hypothetical protein
MPERQFANRSLLLLIIVVTFAMGYLYYSRSIQPGQLSVVPPPITDKDALVMFRDLIIDFSILDDTRFKSLRVFGESPVRPGVTGKRDIFAPF